MEIDYKAEVLAVYPDAYWRRCYINMFAIYSLEHGYISKLHPTESEAWQSAFNNLKNK